MNQEAPKRIASQFQKDIWYDMIHGTSNLVVRAVAGSGKSTTILHGVGLIPKNLDVLLLAFNKDIAAENTSKLPKDSYNVISKTLHGQGSTAMRYNFKSNLNPDKYRTLVRTLMPYWNLPADINADDYRMRVLKLADLARLSLLTTVEEVEALAEEHDVAIINGEASKALQLIEQGSKNTAEIDYTDMVYLPVRLKVRVKKFDVVLVDECQDLSRCQREFMLMHIKPGGKFIAVGDKRQCIYGFAGADADSYEALCAIPNTKQLPLSVTYRCSKVVVRRAQEIVPDIQAAEHAIEGEENEEALLTDVRDRDMVLCRNTFPLVKVCMSYLIRGIKATVQGKDIGTGLINMVKNTNCNNVPQMLQALGKDLGRTREKVMKKRGLTSAEVDEDPTYAAHKERIDVIELFAKNTGSIDDIIAHINSIFADKAKEGIRLSTIHRSKGLEAERVFILSPDLIPAKYARKNPKMLLQEMNLKYVAITRAKSYLGWIEYDAYGKKKKDEENNDRVIRGASKRGNDAQTVAKRIADNSTYGASGINSNDFTEE